MTWAWEQEGLNPTHKLVLLRLADHSNDDGISWPGKDHLADKCNCSRRTVDRAIAALSEAGLVRIRRRRSDQGTDQSNVYELAVKQGDLFVDKAEKGEGVNLTPYSVNMSQGRASERRGEGVTVTPEPSLEPTSSSIGKFADYKPPKEIIRRLKIMHSGITERFIMDNLPEFITYAEKRFDRDQLDEKLIADMTRKWQKVGSRTPPVLGQVNGSAEPPAPDWFEAQDLLLEEARKYDIIPDGVMPIELMAQVARAKQEAGEELPSAVAGLVT